MGRYSKAFSIKKQFQSPNCQTCQGQSRTLKKIVFLELFLRIIEDEKWNLFEKLGQLRTPSVRVPAPRADVPPAAGAVSGVPPGEILCAQEHALVRTARDGGAEVQHNSVQQGGPGLAAGGADPQHHRPGRGSLPQLRPGGPLLADTGG